MQKLAKNRIGWLKGSKGFHAFVFFFSFQFKMWQKYWISRGRGGRPVPGRNIRFHLWNKLSNLASVAPIVGRSYWEISCNTQYHTFCRPLLLSSTGAGQFLLSVSFHVAFPFCITPIKFSLSLFNFHPIYFHFPLCCLTMNLV